MQRHELEAWLGPARAEVIARTEVSDAYRAASMEVLGRLVRT